jgi:hypothetical protein
MTRTTNIPEGAEWWNDGHLFVELYVLPEDAETGYHQGICDDDIADLRRVPYIAAQLDALDPEKMRRALQGWGVWDEMALADDDANRARLLWLACGDIVEGRRGA